MEVSKVSTASTSTISSTAQQPPVLDSIALHTAYFAAQLEQQIQLHLQQQQQEQQQASSSQEMANVGGFLAQQLSNSSEQADSLLPVQLQAFLQQQLRNQQQQQFAPQALPLARHLSAFSPITGPDLATQLAAAAAAANPASQTSAAAQQQPLDLMLLQMQMATTAAAAAAAAAATSGMLPPPFNLLPPATALSLLCAPQFRPMQMNPLGAMQANGLILDEFNNQHQQQQQLIQMDDEANQMNIRDKLFQGRLFMTHSSPKGVIPAGTVSRELVDHTMAAAASHIGSMAVESRNAASPVTSRRHHKQARAIQKRSGDEMAILRSLCDESSNIWSNKRLKIAVNATEIGSEQPSQASETSLPDISFTKLKNCAPTNQRAETKVLEDRSSNKYGENSPNRHHPVNHQPPAMEARFLECMAAIALHSNVPLTISDEMISEKLNEAFSENCNGKSTLLTKIEQPDAESNGNQQVDNNDDGDEMCGIGMSDKKLRSWQHSAIDDELCKEFENYRDSSNVPMIQAFVIPSKSSASTDTISSSSGDATSDSSTAACTDIDEFRSMRSMAVPVPVLNTLLDRILQTMLNQ